MECQKDKKESVEIETKFSTEKKISLKQKDANSEPSNCKFCTNDLTKEQLISMIIRCTNFAALKHTNQRRKNAAETPYINHPIGKRILLFLYFILHCSSKP